MTPEPTPVEGTVVPSKFPAPCTVMRTTAGLTRADASMIADDSSMVTGCPGWLLEVWVPVGSVDAAGRPSAPVSLRIAIVPPDARTADSTDASTTGPNPTPRRATGWGCTGVTGVLTAAGAASYHRSGPRELDGGVFQVEPGVQPPGRSGVGS